MAKRMQEQSEENKIVAKSRPMVTNLTSSVATSSSSVDSPIASRTPGVLKGPSRTEWSNAGKLHAIGHTQDVEFSRMPKRFSSGRKYERGSSSLQT